MFGVMSMAQDQVSKKPSRRSLRALRSLVYLLSRRRRSVTTETTTTGVGESHAPSSSIDTSSEVIPKEVSIVGFYLNSTLLSKHPLAGELERTVQSQKDLLIDERTGALKDDKTVDKDDDPSVKTDAATSTPRRAKLIMRAIDSIEHCPNVEVCLNTSSLQELSPVLLGVSSLSDEPPQEACTSSFFAKDGEVKQVISARAMTELDYLLAHRCQVSASGIEFELVPSFGLERCSLQMPEADSFAIETAPLQRSRSYAIKGQLEDESQMDVESVAVSSLWSSGSGQDGNSDSSFSGTYSSGSGLMEDGDDDDDDMLTAYSGEDGYPSNVYCFEFVDNLDDRGLCTGSGDVVF